LDDVLAGQVPADPADRRHRLGGGLRGQHERLRPHLHRQRRSGRAGLRLGHHGDVLLPDVLRIPDPAGLQHHGPHRRPRDGPAHPRRRAPVLLRLAAPHRELPTVRSAADVSAVNTATPPAAAAPKTYRPLRARAGAAVPHVILIAYAVVALGPIAMIVMNSFK